MNKNLLIAIAALVVTFALFSSTPVRAEDDAHAAADHSAHSARHPFKTHTLGVFVGGAADTGELRDNGVAIGWEYEYRFSSSFGMGGVIEHTFGDIDVYVFGVGFAYHNGPWKMYAAPGIEHSEEGNNGMVRFGVEYGFHVGKWEISPQIDLDFVEREAEVFVVGLVFARGFEL